MAQQDTRTRFNAIWSQLRDDMVDIVAKAGMPQAAIDYLVKNLNYNVPGGKLNRGLSVIDSAKAILGRELSEDEFFRSAVLGWAVELLQAVFLVSDDMMDRSITRRGQPCWYRVEGVNYIAINDSLILESAIYVLLKKYFRDQPYYIDLVELFHETALQTEIGQLLDLLTAPENEVDLSKFSMRRHELIVIYKTAYYSFYLPVALAMHQTGIKNEQQYEAARKILIPLGVYFQIQDDYLDAFADATVLGKVGTDIIDNKCSWCINLAIQLATPEQRKILDENYGRKDANAEKAVKKVYHDLELPRHYQEYEQKVVDEINQNIDALIVPTAQSSAQSSSTPTLKPEVFHAFLKKIYKRSK